MSTPSQKKGSLDGPKHKKNPRSATVMNCQYVWAVGYTLH